MGQIERVRNTVDLIEVRADQIRDLNIPRLLSSKVRPVIFTCRPARLGGGFNGPETERIQLLVSAAENQADYVDVENDADYRRVAGGKQHAKLIVSFHDFKHTPSDLQGIYKDLLSTPADIIKMATFSNSLRDTQRMLELLEHHTSKEKPLVAVAMGDKGFVTRILGPRYGSFLAYASATPDKKTAAGQPTLEELIDVYKIHQITRETKIIGLLGNPLVHSLSPAVHNRAFAQLHLNFRFLPMEADSLEAFLELGEKLDLSGFSITIPYKVRVMKYLDDVDPQAQAIGAVNTVVVDGAAASGNRRMSGYNTDLEGFLCPLETIEKKNPLMGRRVLILGAGGAARTAAYALHKKRAHIIIANRNLVRAQEVAHRFEGEACHLDDVEKVACDMVINTTPVGMYPNTGQTLLAQSYLKNKIVYDLVYNPTRTKLLRDAEACGAETIGGLTMFIHQAAAQFKMWTGFEAPIEEMKTVALKELRAIS